MIHTKFHRVEQPIIGIVVGLLYESVESWARRLCLRFRVAATRFLKKVAGQPDPENLQGYC